MKNWLKENSFLLITSIVLFIVFLIFYYIEDEVTGPVFWIVLYFSILLFSRALPDWKLLKPIALIIEIPAALLQIVYPFLGVLLLIIIMFVFSFAPLIILLSFFPEYPFQIDLNLSAKLYIIIVIGSMALTLFASKYIKYFNSIINNTRPDEKINSQLDFALIFLNKNKIKFIIYIGFLLYLIPYSIATLSNATLFKAPNLDKAVFNAFITYTAFERVLVNIDLMKIDWNEFSKKLFKAWQ